jgi:hypothetical protein
MINLYKKLFFIILITFFTFTIKSFSPSLVSAQTGGECDCDCGCRASGNCIQCPPDGGGEQLDCSNDGVTNQCGGVGVFECPAGYQKICSASSPVCPWPGVAQNYINHYCGTDDMPSTGTMWMTQAECGPCFSVWDERLMRTVRTCSSITSCFNCPCTLVCTGVSPTASTLVSPANGANLTDTNVTLSWSAPSTWGLSCVGGSNI